MSKNYSNESNSQNKNYAADEMNSAMENTKNETSKNSASKNCGKNKFKNRAEDCHTR